MSRRVLVQLTMPVYKVTVATGDILEGGTNNSISITLVGSRGERCRTTIDYWFLLGMVSAGMGPRVEAWACRGARHGFYWRG